MTTQDFSLSIDGFAGSIYYPQAVSENAVIAFTGSDGGLARAKHIAKCFAERGITALALAYFNVS